MRRFQLIDGTSSKFWQGARENASLRIQFGRIGTAGQEQLKSFATDEKAQAELDKLIREKLKKGYTEVGGDGGSAASAAPSVTKVSVPAVKKTTPASAPTPTPTPKKKAVAPVNSARGSVAWTDAALREAAPIRGSDVIPVRAPDARVAYARIAKAMRGFAPMFDAGSKLPNADVAQMTAAREAFAGATAPDTLDLDVQSWACTLAAAVPSFRGERLSDDFIRFWLAKQGAQFALRAYVQSRMATFWTPGSAALLMGEPSDFGRWGDGAYEGWRGLREAAALASDDEHATLLKVAESAARKGRPALRTTLAIAFERPDWCADDVAKLGAGKAPALLWGLMAADQSLGKAKALFARTRDATPYTLANGLVDFRLDLVARHGAAASTLFIETLPRLEETGVERLRMIAEALALIVADDVAEFFTTHLGTNALGALAATYLQTHPAVSIAPLALAAAEKGPGADAARSLLKRIVAGSPEELASIKASLPAEAQQVLTLLDEQTRTRPEATPDELPAILRTPPWTTKVKQSPPRVLSLVPLTFVESMEWKPGESARPGNHWLAEAPDEVVDYLERLRAASRENPRPSPQPVRALFLARLPKEDLLRILPTLDLTKLGWWGHSAVADTLVARHGVEMIGFALQSAEVDAPGAVTALLRARSARVAPLMADAFARLKKSKATACEWLLSFPDAAATGLIPDAVGAPGKARAAAEQALRLVSARGHRATIEATAKSYGPDAEIAVRSVLDFDPMLEFPAKLPKMPSFWAPGAFTRPLLAGGQKSLPLAAVETLGTMLAFSKPDDPYPGIAEVKAACDPRSLAEFAWDLFQAWLFNGAQAKDQWAFAALGLLGDDESARRLTPMVRAWPGEAAHARAVMGLDVLARIGTDVALMHLHGIAQKLKFKGLQEKAREKIDQIAEARGFTAEELADRLVPDLGLDADGSLTLDFGARTFRVTFDETLKPAVTDDAGKRLPDLPKAKQSDDADKAREATDTWKALKKDAKAIASGQVLRLEIAMCAQRRWTTEVFRRFLLQHPLLVHVVRHLIWGTYDDHEKIIDSFRVAEDSSFADMNDETFELPDGARVGIVHRLDLDAAAAATWGQVLSDYKVLQPFAQLSREVVSASKAERGVQKLDRVAGVVVATGKLLGLDNRGWRRGPVMDGGVVGWYEKPMAGAVTASIELDPGIYTGSVGDSPTQTLGQVTLVASGQDHWMKREPLSFGALSPIAFSELVRDLDSLRS